MSLFIRQNVTLHSGEESDFKIECDALTDEDIETIACLISKKHAFKKIIAGPSNGQRLEKALKQYITPDEYLPVLVIDDVFTTGKSMEELRLKAEEHCTGVVIFARGECPDWIDPLFQMWEQ